jgi:hypothetical protein
MWFNPTTLLLGSIALVWDSTKLGSLPSEVRDEPWQFHKANCPNCKDVLWATAGGVKCQKCHHSFTIASCVHCQHIAICNCDFEDAEISQCCVCGLQTKRALAVRNSVQLIYCFALAETLTLICNPTNDDYSELRQQYVDDIKDHFEFTSTTLALLGNYFQKCLNSRRDRFTKSIITSREAVLVEQLIAYATHCIAFGCDSPSSTRLRFIAFVMRLGVDSYTAEYIADCLITQECDWWNTLGVPPDSQIDVVKSAYLAESRKYHPDYAANLSEDERNQNAQRMKELNHAFEAAKKAAKRYGETRSSNEKSNRTPSDSLSIVLPHSLAMDLQEIKKPTDRLSPSDTKKTEPTSNNRDGISKVAVNATQKHQDIFPFKAIAVAAGAFLLFGFFSILLNKQTKKPVFTGNASNQSLISPDLQESESIKHNSRNDKTHDDAYPDSLSKGVTNSIAYPSDIENPISLDPGSLLEISDDLIPVTPTVFDYWYEGVPGYPPRYLALEYIYNGDAYFRDKANRIVKFSIHTLTDNDLEKVIRSVGLGNGCFLTKLPNPRDWTMSVSGVPVRASLVGVLNRLVVLRWENRREYILVELNKLVLEDQTYLFLHCKG